MELRSCDPGAAASPPPPVSPAPVHVLELRAGIIDSLLAQGTITAEQASCTTDNIIGTVGPDSLVRLDEAQADAATVARVRAVTRAAASACAFGSGGAAASR